MRAKEKCIQFFYCNLLLLKANKLMYKDLKGVPQLLFIVLYSYSLSKMAKRKIQFVVT